MENEPVTKVEFAVQMSCQSCVSTVRNALKELPGIKNIDINLEKEQVIIESSLPLSRLQSAIELTGKRAVVKGLGSKPRSAAVAVLGYPVGISTHGVKGVVRLIQTDEETCIVDGTIDGLTPGLHGLHIHSCGDLSQGCDSIGEHYNPFNVPHGGPTDPPHSRHVGDLGNIEANANGRAAFRITDKLLKVPDLIGRSLSVTANRDDLGKGDNETSKLDGNSGLRLACGIIARSAALLENPKKICLCSGITLWEEAETAAPKEKLSNGNV